ncbi:MAG: sugar phosphate nucleotidyltransferase, partial [Myxococcota bacterium]|nr:sugar phosphate nucleotidyltransferase [Myxococcota bacterium]
MSKESLASSGYPEGSLAAAILCAGFGTRLKPITQHLPKPCLPLLGKPLAIHWADRLAHCGIRQLGANVHHLPEQMTRCLHEEAAWAQWSISHERDVILGTGGGVREIWRRVGREKTLLLCHGDVMVASQLAELLALHRSSKAAATLLLVLRTPDRKS